MANRRFDYKKLEVLTVLIFQKLGYTEEQSTYIADVLITADQFGITSHGLQRLNLYEYGLKIGRIKLDAKPKILKETPISALIDADASMGQVTGVESMNLAIKKAKLSGMGMVVTRNNNHFGIAGYYARMAMMQGLLGICMTNSEALMVPTHGKRAMLGSNPIAVAMPAEPFPFMLDMATAVVPRGKLEVYMKDKKPIPSGWAVGSDGKISTDPFEVNECFVKKIPGGILPVGGLGEVLGGHKGYGIAMAVELFTGILAQGYTSDMVRKVHKDDRSCATFIAVDYGMFGEKKEIEKALTVFLHKLRDSDKADGETRIYTHGEKEILYSRECETKGIYIQDKTIEEIREICDRLGIEHASYIRRIS
jgi:LDH2 family malate/lactate/ureidoglycolate dehydrogenase